MFWGLYLVFGRRAVSSLEPLHVTTLMVAGSAVLLTPVALLFAPRLAQHPSAVALGAVVAVLSSAAPYFVELVALRLVRAATYSVLLSLEPAIAALTGFLLIGQTLSALGVAAIVAVMIAAGGASWSAAPAALQLRCRPTAAPRSDRAQPAAAPPSRAARRRSVRSRSRPRSCRA